MEKYIIYSNGKNGYGLYCAHPRFPKEYMQPVEDLFTKTGIVGPSTEKNGRRCYRFAPLGNGYLFSVIYKDCTSADETRRFFAAVNWLFTAEDADEFFKEDVAEHIATKIKESDAVMYGNGYDFPKLEQPIDCQPLDTTENEKRALITSAYFATKAAIEKNGLLGAQVFFGDSTEQCLFGKLFYIINSLPKPMRKLLSFHIGASAARETFGVALSLMLNDVLEVITATGNYDGAMAVKKLCFLRNEFSLTSKLPPVADAYIKLSEEKRNTLLTLFNNSDNYAGYWQYLLSVAEKGLLKPLELATAIGEQALLLAIEKERFNEEQILELFEGRNELSHMPRAVEVITEFAQPIIDKRLVAEALEAARLAEEQAALEAAQKAEEQAALEAAKKAREEKTLAKKKTKSSRKPQKASKKSQNPIVGIYRIIVLINKLLWPYYLFIFCIGLEVAMVAGMYLLGLNYIAGLKGSQVHIAYICQLGALGLLSMPIGALAAVAVKAMFPKRKRRSSDKEESH
ncbi:MAG: hypothetical protein J6B88_08065 [Clostridia bacterium]|nr:hypothetical protein [Clostridia bacterium]